VLLGCFGRRVWLRAHLRQRRLWRAQRRHLRAVRWDYLVRARSQTAWMSTRELFAAAVCALERGHEGLVAAVCLELRMFGRIVEEVVATTLLRAASLNSHYLIPTEL
jgi:hypothetical protein